MRSWTARRWLAASAGVTGFTLMFGLPTDLVPNPVFTRMIEAPGWAYPALAVTAILAGLLVATYVRDVPLRARVRSEATTNSATASGVADARGTDPGVSDEQRRMTPDQRRATAGGLLSFFAVGCPTCNALVVLALGANGALAFFEPIQPYLALAGIALLAHALRRRLRTEASCEVPVRAS